MNSYIYEHGVCPHNYFPNDPSRVAQRIEMKTEDGQIAGWADYFIDNGWSKFPAFFVEETHRDGQIILAFISQVYQMVSEPAQTFWWSATPQMQTYFEQIVALRPDMTFAAGGAINRVARASE